MKTHIIYILIIAIITSILILSIQTSVSNRQNESTTDTIVATKYDTLIIRAAPEVVYISDTIFQTRAFVASLDTTIGTRIITAEYVFPANQFAFTEQTLDTTLMQINSLENRCAEETGFSVAIGVGGGLLLALLLGD